LLVRYIFELTAEEQRRLIGRGAALAPTSPTQQAVNLVKSH
jgi:hypothetical protein